MTLRVLIVVLLTLASCTGAAPDPTEKPAQQAIDVLTSDELAAQATDFSSYWNRGLGELNRYELKQSRYGEIHDGEVVMIFVTEPFLKDKQVKHEFGPGQNATKVLKMHSHRRFSTGIYPYNIHTSSFVPLTEEARALKVAFSATEWCGLVYAQLNRAQEGYRVRSHSYFQAEGDEDFALENAILEDELWATLRKDPSKLPTGDLQIVPGLTFLRMNHKPIAASPSRAERLAPTITEFRKSPLAAYQITYPEHGRTLTIFHEDTFPFRIFGLTESDSRGKTTGKLTSSIMLDYWARHDVDDAKYRDALHLMY